MPATMKIGYIDLMAEKKPIPIRKIASRLGLDPDALLLHGPSIAKVPIAELQRRLKRRDGDLVLVSAMNPTPHGEGKTTTTIGLGDGLSRLGHKTAICLREPSLGPYFGIKGGGTGAGRSQVIPAEDINLHFVGDMYGVEKANNLLAAMTDNHLQHGNELGIDPRRIVLRRVIDLNDRALREIVVGLGGPQHGVPRKDGFNITPASEVMAILCLAKDFQDLGRRLARIIVGFTYAGRPVTAADIKAVGAMQVLLRDAIHPNLVQTMEGTPAFVHAGPFANIAQGTNSAVATRLALKCADIVVTEAGFGSDLGAEKFFDIKCRSTGLKPSAAVIVATCRAVAYHGGPKDGGGLDNLAKHIENIRHFGIDPVVAINRFADDAERDIERIVSYCSSLSVKAVPAGHFARGGAGATELAKAVLESVKLNRKKTFRFLYPLSASIPEKIETIARKIYGASDVVFDKDARRDLEILEKNGLTKLAVCVAKTPLSLSDEPSRRGRPRDFTLTVNELRVSAGAGFIVAICGHIMTMPGLPKVPAAARIKVLPDGRTTGLT
jgi:formate--tetrahydrofolate ligase